MEAREPSEKSIELMENTLINYGSIIGSIELIDLLTNLAYFYERESCEEEKAKPLLEKAVALKGNYPNPYNALSIIFLNENKNKDALNLLSKTISISDEIEYYNNYAVALYIDGQINDAVQIFYQISAEWESKRVAEIAYYSYGMIKGITGNYEVGSKVANDLSFVLDSAQDVDRLMLAELFYVCEEYDKCIEMYELNNLYPSTNWLRYYFYSYHITRTKDEFFKVYNESIAYKGNEILDTQNDEDESFAAEDKEFHIKDLINQLEEIKLIYNSITNHCYKPKISFEPQLIYGCYLVDCPRHSQ